MYQGYLTIETDGFFAMEKDGWSVAGLVFKKENSNYRKEVNKEIWSRIIPWNTWLAIPDWENEDYYWLLQKEV